MRSSLIAAARLEGKGSVCCSALRGSGCGCGRATSASTRHHFQHAALNNRHCSPTRTYTPLTLVHKHTHTLTHTYMPLTHTHTHTYTHIPSGADGARVRSTTAPFTGRPIQGSAILPRPSYPLVPSPLQNKLHISHQAPYPQRTEGRASAEQSLDMSIITGRSSQCARVICLCITPA